MAGPQHGIMGAGSSPLDLPVKDQVTQEDNSSIQNAARFSKTAEFQQLKELIEAKISRWQHYVPGGSGEVMAGDAVNIKDLTNEERGYRWLAADYVISELRGIVNAYEQAAELAKNETTQ